MRHQKIQLERRDSKELLIVDDDDCGIPTAEVDNHRAHATDGGPESQTSRGCLLSMGGYDKGAVYDLYQTEDYQTAGQPVHSHPHASTYAGFASHSPFAGEYAGPQAQVPSALSQHHVAAIEMVQAGQTYSAHDAAYYGQQAAHYPSAYLPVAAAAAAAATAATVPRPSPENIGYEPSKGDAGTKVTVYFESVYDFDIPTVAPAIMFGHKRCDGELKKAGVQSSSGGGGGTYSYALSSTAPPLASTGSTMSQVPLHLVLDDGSGSVAWQAPTIELGSFSYLGGSNSMLDTPQMSVQQLQPRKRKLSAECSPRRSPTKKTSLQDLRGVSHPSSSPYRVPSAPEAFRSRRTSQYHMPAQSPGYIPPVPRMPSYYVNQVPPVLQNSTGPSWHYYSAGAQPPGRTPMAAMSQASHASSTMSSSSSLNNPTLIRTSILQQPAGGMVGSSSGNALVAYSMYPTNAKAVLRIDGDLSTMADKWTEDEWTAKRRLVQFRRSQNGSVITTTFEPVTPEARVPQSICVSCIWWEERQECFVTSVDTISLLESLVAVRFTVEEKNRIRRNLEGFHPVTVSKTKPDSEEYFKLIMGFPNPKPRNIEKDVKVFPWRVLHTALKKIISKYVSQSCFSHKADLLTAVQSASYSSTAAAMPSVSASPYVDNRAVVTSPRSSISSAASRGPTHTPTVMPTAYNFSGGPVSSLSVPATSAAQHVPTSWHQPAGQYHASSDMGTNPRPTTSWAHHPYNIGVPASGLPGTAYPVPYQQRVPTLTGPSVSSDETRFVPPLNYDDQSEAQHLPPPAT